MLQRGHVLPDRRDPAGLGHRLDDEPGRAGRHREFGGPGQQTVGALVGRRVDAHVGVDDDVPLDPQRGEQLRAQAAQRQDRFPVLVRVGLLRVADRHVVEAVLAEEERLQHADRDELAGRAELTQHAAAEGLQVRPRAQVPGACQQPAGRGPVAYGHLQRHAAVGQAVGHGPAFGGVEAGSERRGEDVLRCRRSVPHLHGEGVVAYAVEHPPGGGRVVGGQGIAVETGSPAQGGAGGRQVADPGVAVDGDRADRGRRRRLGGDQSGTHLLGGGEAHPRLHDEPPGGGLLRHEVGEAAHNAACRSPVSAPT